MNEEKLKKEAWEYMVDHAILNDTNEDVEQAYFDAAKPREEKIAALKKENEELKKSIKYVNTICERKSVTNSQLTELAADSSAKLCEAKKIIKDLLLMAKVENLERNYESVDEAKQFLEEVKE